MEWEYPAQPEASPSAEVRVGCYPLSFAPAVANQQEHLLGADVDKTPVFRHLHGVNAGILGLPTMGYRVANENNLS